MGLQFLKTLVLCLVGVLNSKTESHPTLIERELSFEKYRDINCFVPFFLVYLLFLVDLVVFINGTRETQEPGDLKYDCHPY
jgi:hypothetical protein